MTVVQLKALLKERGLKVSGNKAELIERLESSSTDEDGGSLPQLAQKTGHLVERMWGRIQDAREAGNPTVHQEHGAEQSGRRAESSVTQQLASSRALFGDLRVWHSLRVPLGRGRREIDHVVLDAAGLHVLEIKHWSGSVSLEGGEWVQTRANGSTVRHGDVLATHEAKVRALLEFLRTKGLELPAAAVHQRILLTSPNCTPSAEVSRLDGVLSCDGVVTYLGTFEQSILSNVASRVLPRSLGGRRLNATQVRRALTRRVLRRRAWPRQPSRLPCPPPPHASSRRTPRPLRTQTQAAIEALDSLGTWDRLTLNGGRVINGDARGFSCGGKPHVVYELPRLRQVASQMTTV